MNVIFLLCERYIGNLKLFTCEWHIAHVKYEILTFERHIANVGHKTKCRTFKTSLVEDTLRTWNIRISLAKNTLRIKKSHFWKTHCKYRIQDKCRTFINSHLWKTHCECKMWESHLWKTHCERKIQDKWRTSRNSHSWKTLCECEMRESDLWKTHCECRRAAVCRLELAGSPGTLWTALASHNPENMFRINLQFKYLV